MKQLIIYAFKNNNIYFKNFLNKDKYDYIAVENGNIFFEKMKIKPKIIIGDFDTISQKNIKNKILIKDNQFYTDLEYSIIWAIKNNYLKIYCFASGKRKDHSLTNILLVKKYGIILFEEQSKIYKINKSTTIMKDDFKYISFYSFEKQKISCNGVKYPFINKNIALKNTEFISNEIINEKCFLEIQKELLIIQS